MRFEIRQVDVSGGQQQLAGRIVGERLFREAVQPAVNSADDNTILLLSFRGVEFVTGSVFKATWHELHPETGVRVPCMVAHLSEDVRIEFQIYLKSERVAGLEAIDWSSSQVKMAALHGVLEDSAFNALNGVAKMPGSTAPQLQGASSEQVSPTAWTNRLNELYRQGLAFREKAGRAWRFHPLAREVRRG